MRRNPLKIRNMSLAQRRIPKPRLYIRKIKSRMTGGPVSELYLSAPGTLMFRLGSWMGRYDSSNKWVEHEPA